MVIIVFFPGYFLIIPCLVFFFVVFHQLSPFSLLLIYRHEGVGDFAAGAVGPLFAGKFDD